MIDSARFSCTIIEFEPWRGCEIVGFGAPMAQIPSDGR